MALLAGREMRDGATQSEERILMRKGGSLCGIVSREMKVPATALKCGSSFHILVPCITAIPLCSMLWLLL